MNGNKRNVGLVIPTANNSFFANLADEITSNLSKKGYHTQVFSSLHNAEKEKEIIRMLPHIGVNGVICVSGLSECPSDLFVEDYPVVWVDRQPKYAEKYPWVSNDDSKAMEQATGYLLRKGCRNILLLPGYTAEHQEAPRVSGYKMAFKTHGILCNEEYILHRQGVRASEVETEELIRGILRDGRAVDGIITSSDRSAFGAMKALTSVGYYVPEDVRMICFDNSPYTAMSMPSITAIDRNPMLIAMEAVRMITGMMEGTLCGETHVTVPVSLIIRDSVR